MSFILDRCSLYDVVEREDIAGFVCGDKDLDEFFANDCFDYSRQLLGKTYCYKLDEDTHKIVCAFTLANAGIRVSDLPNARKKKVEANIPHIKSLKDYPALLIGRLGVSKDFQSMHIGSEVLDFIKAWFVEPNNKTGCRFIIVDAYNNETTLAFYERNGFKTVFSSVEQEQKYRQLPLDKYLGTRLMYFDLLTYDVN